MNDLALDGFRFLSLEIKWNFVVGFLVNAIKSSRNPLEAVLEMVIYIWTELLQIIGNSDNVSQKKRQLLEALKTAEGSSTPTGLLVSLLQQKSSHRAITPLVLAYSQPKLGLKLNWNGATEFVLFSHHSLRTSLIAVHFHCFIWVHLFFLSRNDLTKGSFNEAGPPSWTELSYNEP